MRDIFYKELKTTFDGDLDIADSITTMYGDQDIIIRSNKGQNYRNLLLGVGIFKYLNGPINGSEKIKLDQKIKSECKKEGIAVKSITIVDNNEFLIKSEQV